MNIRTISGLLLFLAPGLVLPLQAADPFFQSHDNAQIACSQEDQLHSFARLIRNMRAKAKELRRSIVARRSGDESRANVLELTKEVSLLNGSAQLHYEEIRRQRARLFTESLGFCILAKDVVNGVPVMHIESGNHTLKYSRTKCAWHTLYNALFLNAILAGCAPMGQEEYLNKIESLSFDASLGAPIQTVLASYYEEFAKEAPEELAPFYGLIYGTRTHKKLDNMPTVYSYDDESRFLDSFASMKEYKREQKRLREEIFIKFESLIRALGKCGWVFFGANDHEYEPHCYLMAIVSLPNNMKIILVVDNLETRRDIKRDPVCHKYLNFLTKYLA